VLRSRPDRQTGQTTTAEQSSDPYTDAGRKVVQNPCVQEWYAGGATEPLDQACPCCDVPDPAWYEEVVETLRELTGTEEIKTV